MEGVRDVCREEAGCRGAETESVSRGIGEAGRENSFIACRESGRGAFGCPGRQSGSSHEKKRFEAGAGVAGQLCFLRE